jgi:hypothetical protein
LIFGDKNVIKDYLEYYSYFTRYIPTAEGYEGKYFDSATHKLVRIEIRNAPALTFYLNAFSEGGKNSIDCYNRIILETSKNKDLKFPETTNEWITWGPKNKFCYELKVPLRASDKIYGYMQQDIERYFGYSAKIEKRKVKCLVLSAPFGIEKIKTISDSSYINDHDDHTMFVFKNQRLNSFFSMIKQYNYNQVVPSIPILNEIEYTGNVDLLINSRLDDILSLRSELRKYGLELNECYREIDMLVIRDKK